MNEPSVAAIVFVVDDDAAVRDSTVLFLVHRGFTVRAFASAEEFLENFDAAAIGCLLLDLRMPGMSGLELQAVLCERGADIPIVFLTGHGDVRQTVVALKRGALDFIEKPWDQEMLASLVGDAVTGHARARRVLEDQGAMETRRELLTQRENQVLDQLVAGGSSKRIARTLQISHRTVETHRANLMRKLQVSSLAELLTGLAPQRANTPSAGEGPVREDLPT